MSLGFKCPDAICHQKDIDLLANNSLFMDCITFK